MPIILFLICSTLYANCFNPLNNNSRISCPKTESAIPLSNIHKPLAIFLGYEKHGSTDNSAYLLRLIKILNSAEPNLKVNLVLSKSVLEATKLKGLETILETKRDINLIPISEEMPAWMQDPIEFTFNPKKNEFGVIGLPYNRSPNIYKDIAKSCNIKAISSGKITQLGGNHGGNIEHLFENKILIGDSATDDLKNFFRKKNLNIIDVSVDWLEVGHVDEVLVVLPGVDNCPLSIGYASPIKALTLLTKDFKGLCNTALSLELKKIGFQTKNECLDLLRASNAYEKITYNNALKIKESIKCAKLIPFPTILFPEKLEQLNYGNKADKARSLLPNPVNSVVLGKSILVPWQRIKSYQDYLSKVLKPLGLIPYFIKNKHIHWSGGNLHCTTNTIRTCKN